MRRIKSRATFSSRLVRRLASRVLLGSRKTRALQLRYSRFDVFELNRLGRMVQQAVGRPCLRRWGVAGSIMSFKSVVTAAPEAC
jgi:hypothetical protein